MVVHQVDNPSIAQSFFPLGTVPTFHVSYHLGEHYNSVRHRTDPGNQPIAMCPIGHELFEIDGYDEQEEKKEECKKQAIIDLVKSDQDVPTRKELVSYACTVAGLPDAELMRTALFETFGNEDVAYETFTEMLQVVTQIYESYEVAKVSAANEEEYKEI